VKRKLAISLLTALFFLLPVMMVHAGSGGGIDDPEGVPLYVIIEVEWDGDPAHDGSWTVFGPLWDPVVDGPILSSCSIGPVGTCLEMSYEFTFRGKTVHFDEVMVPTVDATPQSHHVVLFDLDGDGTYTGSLAASHYFPWRPEPDGSWATLYFDRIDYTITFDENGNVVWFHYLQYEHKKL
jgi:hypothetical protein